MLVDQYTSFYQIQDGEPRPTLEQSQENLVHLMAHYPIIDLSYANDYHRFLLQVQEVNQALVSGMRIAWRSTYAIVHFGLLRSIAVEYDGNFSRERFGYDIVLHQGFDFPYRTALVPLAQPEKPYSGKRLYISSDWDNILTQVNAGGHTHRWEKNEHRTVWCDFCEETYNEYVTRQHHPSHNEADWHIEHAVDIHFPLEERELIRIYDRHPDKGGILRLLLHVDHHQLHWGSDEIMQMMQQAVIWQQPADRWQPSFWVANKSLYDQDISYSLIWWYAVNWPGCGIVKSYGGIGELINDWRWGLANQRIPRRA
jgi:hypothetical protein